MRFLPARPTPPVPSSPITASLCRREDDTHTAHRTRYVRPPPGMVCSRSLSRTRPESCTAECFSLATDSVAGRSNQGLTSFAAYSPAGTGAGDVGGLALALRRLGHGFEEPARAATSRSFRISGSVGSLIVRGGDDGFSFFHEPCRPSGRRGVGGPGLRCSGNSRH